MSTADCRNDVNTWLCFQKTQRLDKRPHKAHARIAADSKYWLWVNGRRVVIEGNVKRGPTPRDTYYDDVDLAPYLVKGNNVISILVWYYGKEGFSHKSSGQAGLFFDCTLDRGGRIVSDATWRGRLHPAFYTPSGDGPNYRLPESNIGFDARKDNPLWQSMEQSAWPHVFVKGVEGGAPWGLLRPRVIPQWKDYGLRDYVKQEVRHGQDVDTLVCELPYDAQVMPCLEATAPAGRAIGIETDTYVVGPEKTVRGEYITKEGVQAYEHMGWMSGNRVYYIYQKGVTLTRVQYRETGFDTELAGSFTCDDPFWNRYWRKAQRTLYVNMRDTYFDCPDRERAQWAGDEAYESGQSYYALSPSSHLLMKKGFYEVAGWQRADSSVFAPIPAGNWDRELPGQMLNLLGYYGLWNYYMNTGDRQTLGALYPVVQRYLDSWRAAPDGTMAARSGGWYWGDWGDNIDKIALYNAFYYLALKGQHEAAIVLGKADDAVRIAARMSKLKEAFNRVFWQGGYYRHPDYKDETDDRVQAVAVVAGLADADKWPAIFQILKTTEHASPCIEKYVAEALFKMGHGDYALSRMKRRYALMVNDTCHTTLYEGWDMGNFGMGGSCNHAWSGGGIMILSGIVCGVQPLEAGYACWRVAPCPTGLRHARTVVPTVKGTLMVSFEVAPDGITITVKAPRHTSGQVVIPVGYAHANQVIEVKGSGQWTFRK